VREPDGLAMSSRNAYLNPQERKSALSLHRSLIQVKNRFDQGEHNAALLIEAGKQSLAQEPAVRLDYLEIVDPTTLDPIQQLSGSALVAVAAFVGNTRLIDNIPLPDPKRARAT
jgi:pantoate--beta-alanine ligase